MRYLVERCNSTTLMEENPVPPWWCVDRSRYCLLLMDLIERIEQALATRTVEAAEFERCAVALLQAVYPGLSAIEGGHDFGRDADIYFPLDTGRGGRLLATTMQDPRLNVSRGLGRMHAEGLSTAVLVVATSQPLSASKRRAIENVAAEAGIADTHVYARDWFVGQLAKDPVWRKRLLNVTGELGALVRIPLSTLSQPVTRVGLVGRSDDLAQLTTLQAESADVVLSGVPGCGKTRLLTELGGATYFVEPATDDRVIDDLLIHSPDTVVIDDAHARLPDLMLLQRARLQEGISFQIVATTWPEQAESVLDVLQGAKLFVLPLLERGPMDELLRSARVDQYGARSLILNQAAGRPGWALALVEVLRQRGGDDIVSGAALLQQVQWFLRRSARSDVAVDALACIAALDPSRDQDLEPLARLIKIPLAELTRVLSESAINGLLDRTPEGWQLLPALRAPLLARWFFDNPPRRPWSTLESAFAERRQSLRMAVVNAASTGTQGALAEADSWARSLPSSPQWDLETWAVADAYAALDEPRAAWAVDNARTVLASPRETRTYEAFETTIDPIGDRAKELLADAARRFLVPEAIIALLELSLGDDRPRPQNPDHPLRVLTDLAKGFHPDFGTSVEIRKLILDPALTWFIADCNRRWPVVAEVLEAVFAVRVSGSWPNLGQPHAITIADTLDSAENLNKLVILWTETVAPILKPEVAPIVHLDPAPIARLLDLADEWLRLGSGRHLGQEQATDEHREVGAAGGEQIIATIRSHLQAHPGLALRGQRILEDNARSDLESFSLDPDLVALVGPRIDDDYDAYKAERATTLSALAGRLSKLSPDDAARRFAELEVQATVAGGFSEHAWGLATHLRLHMTDPLAWLAAAVEARNRPLLEAALDIVLHDPKITVEVDRLREVLADRDLRNTAISTVLSQTDMSPTVELVLTDLDANDARWLRHVVMRRENADPVLHKLLTHPVQRIASMTALGFRVGIKYGPPLPPEWREDWEEAVVRSPGDDLEQHDHHRLAELLTSLAADDEPDLVERWYNKQLDEMLNKGFLHPPEPYGSDKALARLPEPHREQLIRRCAGVPTVGTSPLAHLLGSDTALAKRLLDQGVLAPNDVLLAMLGRRSMLEALGPDLVQRGTDPATIAETAEFASHRWGEDSDAFRKLRDYFQGLLDAEDPELRAIAHAGVDRADRAHQAALEAEHLHRVRGEL